MKTIEWDNSDHQQHWGMKHQKMIQPVTSTDISELQNCAVCGHPCHPWGCIPVLVYRAKQHNAQLTNIKKGMCLCLYIYIYTTNSFHTVSRLISHSKCAQDITKDDPPHHEFQHVLEFSTNGRRGGIVISYNNRPAQSFQAPMKC